MAVSAYYTLDQVVKEYLLEANRQEKEYRRFLNFALSGLRRLRTNVTKDGKVRVKITPNALNRYDFPDDMEEFIALYVPVDGRIWTLTRNNEIIPTKTVSGIDESNDSDYGEGVSQPTSQIDTFTSRGGVNLQGYFTLDYESREIVINNNDKTELVLEYSSVRATTSIPTKYVEALKAWMSWRDVINDRTMPPVIKRDYERNYKQEAYEVKKIEGPSLQEWFDAYVNKSAIRQ